MENNGNSRPLAVIVGERLRAFREAKGLRQEDISEMARTYGFNWGRSSVAALEGGNRELSFAELIMLPSMIRSLGGWEEPLIVSNESIALNDSLHIPAGKLGLYLMLLLSPSAPVHVAGLASEDYVLDLGAIPNPPKRSESETERDVARKFVVHKCVFLKLWPDREIAEWWDSWFGGTEVLVTIANRLVTPNGEAPSINLVRAFSLGMWGRLPGDERDARADARGSYGSKRALQSARGHVTRELIQELQDEIYARWPEAQGIFDELDRVIDDEKELGKWTARANDLENERRRIGKFRAASDVETLKHGLGLRVEE